jgi:hypothetical protein
MKKIFLFFAGVLFSISYLPAQHGHFYLTNHVPRTVTFENTNFKIIQNSQGILYIANNRGLIAYDGTNWDFIETPEAIFSIAIDQTDQIFIGGQSGFGRLIKVSRNEFLYESLSDSVVSANEIFEIKEHLGKIYFLNQKAVFIYESGKISELRLKDASVFRTFAPLPQELLAITNDGRVLSISESLKSFDPGIGYDVTLETSFLSPDKSKAILIDSDGNLFLYENRTAAKIVFNDKELLSKFIVTSGVWLEGDILAIGSLESGVVFLDLNKKTLLEVLNYESGLPDNQIFSMTRDRVENSLWISHAYGFSRVSPFLPFHSYGRFPGINGKLLTGYFGGNQIYLGTSVGLFRLQEVREFREKVIYVPVRTSTGPTSVQEAEKLQDEKKSRRGLFGFLRRKEEEEKEAVVEQQQIKLQRRVVREETSREWKYKKIEGIHSRVMKLVGTNGGIVAASLSGLFEVKGNNEIPISSEPFTFVHAMKGIDGVIAAGANGGVSFFRKSGDNWSSYPTFSEIEEYIQFIFQDSKNNIWLLGPNVAYKATLFQDVIDNLEFWPIENPFYSTNIGAEINGQVNILNSNSLYTFNEITKEIEKKESTNLWSKFPERTISDLDGTIWIYDGKDWSPLGSQYLTSRKIRPISLFNEVSFLTYDKDSDSFWIITGENDLYKMSNKDTIVSNHLPLLLREIKNGQRLLPIEGNFEIQQNQNSLGFNFLKADFDNLFKIEYRYKLEGLNASWSEWSGDFNNISFPFLPEGNYVLNFESRDVFGQINSLEPFTFKIVPPYWKRPWFYGVEIIAFGGLFLLSFRLNRIDHKYKFLSKLLAFLTLILAVEFIQIVAELKFPSGNSPVTGFFIQVFIALVLLPLEGVVRRAVFRIEETQDMKAFNKKAK